MKTTAKLWIAITILVVISPLGLIIPSYFKAKSAWGEWSTSEMQQMTGYVPKGLAKLSTLWNAPMPDYAFRGWEEKGLRHLSFAYIVSAIAGIVIIYFVALLTGKILTRKNDERK